MTTETQDWQLEAAQGVLMTWENILQDQVVVARSAGRPQQEVFTLQQTLYATARERKALARLSPDEVSATSKRYRQLIIDLRAKAFR